MIDGIIADRGNAQILDLKHQSLTIQSTAAM
jgi:hypothetical protein